ncbi:hypothetical protein [Halocalculus aciditolerans]|uniref:Uncharacterized protein n=1 Tax=Halocalculus aciditolerans TaxID=1383812 RepID=A0A830FNK6_9EURY|nr:hypothetical protein [Halocalculus aciditolerans]GGL64944.1 hypothetical protein GCM10009039_23630 [Halocalculus aciditolerans]
MARSRSTPPEQWGPEQNAVVNGQVDAARESGPSAAHRERVESVAESIIDVEGD